jgi:sec-independent protein translocase protein TatC
MHIKKQEVYMNFWEHLEAFRWHVIRSLIAILLLSLLVFSSKHFIVHTVLLGPSRPDFWTYRMLQQLSVLLGAPDLAIGQQALTFQSRQLTGQFTMHFSLSLTLGFIGAFPYMVWEFWRFVNPAIKLSNRKILFIMLLISFLLVLGLFFGYWIITPLVIQFLNSYQLDQSIINAFDITSYISMVLTLVLACTWLFQLPLVTYFMAKLGIVTAQRMRTYRRHAIVFILTLSAIITPPDVMSQVLLAIPLMLLYEFSIFIAQLAAQQAS